MNQYLKEISILTLDDGTKIYSCVPNNGIKIMSLGFWKTEQEAKDEFTSELIKRGYLPQTQP